MLPHNCKLKWDTTTHLLEWWKFKVLTTSKLRENVEQKELSFIAGVNTKWYRHFERQFTNFLENEYAYHMIQKLCSLVFTQRSFCILHKNLYTNIYSSFIHNYQNLEAMQMSFNRWMDKQTVVYLYNVILLSARKKLAIKPQKDMVELPMHLTKWKNPI